MIMPLVSYVQIKVLVNDLALLLDLLGNSKGTKLLIYTIIFCLVFTAPEKLRVELRAKTGQYHNRCFGTYSDNFCFNIFSDIFQKNVIVVAENKRL